MSFLTGAPLKVLSVRLHSKSNQKSSQCQNLLTEKTCDFKGAPVKKDTLYLTLPYLFAKTKASQQISSLPQWLKTLGRMECAAAKLLLVTLVGFQLVFFIPIPFELFLLT